MTDLSGDGVRILVLATATHTDAALPPLPTVARTYDDLRAAFVERCGAAPENVVGVLNPPDARTMAAAIAEEAARARSVLVVYFIGHGLRGPGGELFLAAVETGELVPGLAAHQALSFGALAQAVQRCRAPAVAVILDCCFSGIATLDADTASIREFASGAHGRSLIASAEHLASAPAGQRHTAFTGALLRLLEQGDPREPAWLTLNTLASGLHRLLRETQKGPLPRINVGDRSGELVIAPNPAAATSEEPAREPVPGRSPYPGLASFGPEDAGMFFGRDAMLEVLLTEMSAAVRDGAPRVLVGASGSGKTSLLNAGFIAAVRDRGLPGLAESAGSPIRRCTPGADPLQRLANALDAPDARDMIEHDPEQIVEFADRLLADRPESTLVLIVDQLEELFTLGASRADRTAFLTALNALAAPRVDTAPRADGGPRTDVASGADAAPRAHAASRVLVLTALRADFYGHAATHPELVAALRNHQILIDPMTRAELREAIEKPASGNGWTLTDGLTDVILNDLGQDSTAAAAALPLLSHAMLSTWTRRDGNRLTVAGYRDTGGIASAIRQSAEAVYTDADTAGRHALRMMLPRLIRVGVDGDADTAQPADHATLTHGIDPDTARNMVSCLVEARLITVDRDTIRLSHEALLREWPRLREWIDTDREWLHRSQRFIADSRIWRQSGSDPAFLYRGTQLAAIRDRAIPADRDPIEADPTATEFLTAATRSENRRTLQRRAFVGTLLVLVVALTAVTGVALWARNQANHQRDVAASRLAAFRATQLRETQPALSQQLAFAGYRIAATDEARQALAQSAGAPRRTLLAPDPAMSSLTTDGAILAVAYRNGTIVVLDSAQPRTGSYPATTIPEEVTALAFEPGTTRLAVGTRNGVTLWDVGHADRIPMRIASLPGARVVNSLAWSPDGAELAAATDSGVVRLPITAAGEVRGQSSSVALRGRVTAVEYSADGAYIAAGDAVGEVWLGQRTQRDLGVVGVVPDGPVIRTIQFTVRNDLAILAGVDVLVVDAATRKLRYAGYDTRNKTKLNIDIDYSNGGETAGGEIRVATTALRLFDSGDSLAAQWMLSGYRNGGLSEELGDSYSIIPAAGTAGSSGATRMAGTGPVISIQVVRRAGIASAITISSDGTVLEWADPLGSSQGESGNMSAPASSVDIDKITSALCRDSASTLTPPEWSKYLPEATYRNPCR
ncbi:caspase, EACC1-associated type [Nocardia macrotermitis]|uniref:Novel STAND NTPase 1 domain-containing protein n=1 Tax=Nocardia macrotermitis TaxID=2585198 RepID=A0A7K0DE20_9NOCA|nr:caspase family protein [Nocardia macrotermitis]MQY23918.1 hypothetical protein [Nocardia macrotermitis]